MSTETKPQEQLEIEVCPICKRPASYCSFFSRISDLKFDDDPKESARKRSRQFLRFHADTCQRCQRSLEECKRSRLISVFRKADADGRYLTPEGIARLLEEQKCQKFRYHYKGHAYKPAMPEWWPYDQR